MKSFLESLVSDQTRRSYKRGLEKFTEFYKKGPKGVLKEKDAGKIIEKFYVWLRKKYTQNSCRALTNPIIQYCKYNDVEPKIRKSLGIYRTTLTTRDHMLSVEEAREMYEVGSLEEKVTVKTWLLGLRIADACRLQWKQLDFDKVGEEPREVLVHTRKEGIVAHVFVDQEFQRLLTKHIPNLNQENPYLFQSQEASNLKERQLLRKLQSLQKRAHIKARGRFGWHIARKLFMRTCAELGVNQWNAKLMVGKAVDKSIRTYINGVSLKKDAEKVLNVLRMEPAKANGRINSIQEIAHVAAEALMEFLEPVIEKKLLARQASRGGESLGLMTKPDLSGMSTKEKLELYIKLVREEKEKWR